MEIPEEKLQEFMRLYEKHVGETIERADAFIQAHKLLELVQLLLRDEDSL